MTTFPTGNYATSEVNIALKGIHGTGKTNIWPTVLGRPEDSRLRIIPHVVRGLTGTNHWKLLPVSALFGALFMVICDILCRTIIEGSELPIGIITAFCGAPVFAYIMIRRTYNFGGS